MAQKPIARVGDKHECPIKGHGVTTIVAGDPNFVLNGKQVARVGDKTECGATIVAGANNTSLSNGQPVAYLGSKTDHGGEIITGYNDYLVDV